MSQATAVSNYAQLSREQLAILVPELLLIGQLIDRSGMAWAISELGREGMGEVAIEEWMAASPIYTKRMQRALQFEGDDVPTVFKGIQLDIGAPPQFMDFRFTIYDRWNGMFELAHCGALMDVEPMGSDYVRTMCHDIEDPTFDATAVATNPKAQVRPIHRPPRVPADRSPVCAWSVKIRDEYPPVHETEGCTELRGSHAANCELAEIDPTSEGRNDYAGPLVADLDFTEFSHSALVRLADEVCLQMHLLNLGYIRAVKARTKNWESMARSQLLGIAGVAARRLVAALEITDPVELLRLHPIFNPSRYVWSDTGAQLDAAGLAIATSPAHADGSWITYCGPDNPEPLQAVVQALDPHYDVNITGNLDKWRLEVVWRDTPAEEFGAVAVTAISTGASWEFTERRSLPIIPV